MHHLTNFYRNKCEQLEEQKNILIQNLATLLEMKDGNFDFKEWLSSVQANQANAPIRPTEDGEGGAPTPYGKQAMDIIGALSDPNHPAHQSAFMKHTLFSMLTPLGVSKEHIDRLKNLPHNINFPSPGSNLY